MSPNRPNPSQPRGSPAFGLIELIVSIAIIAVLIAIAMPAIGAVRARAQGAQSLSNMRQIALGVRVYAEDHAGIIPFFVPGLPAYDAVGRQSLRTVIDELTNGVEDVWLAPADPEARLPREDRAFVPYTSFVYPPGQMMDALSQLAEPAVFRRRVSAAFLDGEARITPIIRERTAWTTDEPQGVMPGQY